MEMRENYPPCHLWHSDPAAGTADKMLLKYIDKAEDRSSQLFKRLETDLTECWSCMRVYHKARERLVRKEPQTGYYDRFLLNLEEKRVKQSLSQETEDEAVLFLAVHEVTEHPFLLFNQEIASAFCSKLMELKNSMDLEAFLPRRIPSMYLLVIHPIREVRELAWQCLQNHSIITSDLYDDISTVLNWVLNLHIAGCLHQPVTQVSYHQPPSKADFLPRHLYCTQSHSCYWQGVTRLFEILSEDALKHHFMHSESHQQFFPVLVDTISTQDEVSGTDSLFWCQLQCLTHLMDKLGSTVWQDISMSKSEGFFEFITTRHPVFLAALESLCDSGSNSTSVRRNNCAVTQSSLLVDPSEPIQWIVTYLKSLLDFGDKVSGNFCVVITFLCSKLSEQLGYSETDADVEVRRRKPLDSLIEKLLLPLVRVLECLQKNSLLGTLVGKNKTPQWLKVLLTFLKQHPPVCSKSNISRLIALSNESRQLLMDVFRSSKKPNKASIGQSVRYIKMLSLPQRLSTAKPGSSAAQNGDLKKLWEINLQGKEFNDCVKFVEETLQVLPRTSNSRAQRPEEQNYRHQLLHSSIQSLMSTPATPEDIVHSHEPTQLPLNTNHSNASGSSSPSTSDHSESVLSPVAPSRRPCRNLEDEFAMDLVPSQDESFEVQCSQEWELNSEENEILKIFPDSKQESELEVEDQTLPNGSTPKADKGCSAKYKPLISSGDEVALISDITEVGESSSSLEDGLGVHSVQSEFQEEEQQIQLEGGSPCVVLERIPELEELDRSIKQMRVTSIKPLVIDKLKPNSRMTRPECSTSSSFNRDVSLHGNKEEKMQQDVQEDEEEVVYQSTHCASTPPRPFISSLSSSLSGTPLPKSRHSSNKYPRNRLSLKKNKQRRHFVSSSSDEAEGKTRLINPDIPEMKQPCKMKEAARKETPDNQDQEFVTRDEVETPIVNPDIQEIKQPHQKEEDAEKETCNDQDQELVTRDDRDEEEEMELSDSSLSCPKDNSEGGRTRMIHSDEITEIAEVAKKGSSSDEELPGREGVSNLIGSDNDDEVMQDLTNSNSDDSEYSPSFLTQSDPPTDVPSPRDTTCSTDSFVDSTVFQDKRTGQDESNNHVSPDNDIDEVSLISDASDEDIKPIPGFINLKRKSPFSSSNDDSSMLSFAEEQQEDNEIIDVDSYNLSQLFDEDRFGQLIECIEISSDSELDLDRSETELNIDLEAVKKEREDTDQHELGTKGGVLPETQSEQSLDFALHNDNDADTMWYRDEDVSNDGDDERAEGDVDDEGEEDNQDVVDDVFPMENNSEDVQAVSAENEEEFARTEKNEKLTAKVFYGQKPTAKRCFPDASPDHEGDSDNFSNDQQTVPVAGRFGREKENAGLTWESLEAEALKKTKNKIKRKKRKKTQDKQMHCQGASKLATSHEGTLGDIQSGVDVLSTSRRPAAEPRVPGSWKLARNQPLESTDAEPMKTIDSSKQPIVTDKFVLDDSQTYKRHKPTNQQEDKPRAAMQTVPSRFKSRNSILTQDIKKGTTNQRDGMAKTRHSSGGHDVGASKVGHDSLSKEGGPSKTRHASSPSSVRQMNRNLSVPSPNRRVFDGLPTYAHSVYNNKSSIPAAVVSAAGKSLPNIPGATEPSCHDARLTNPEHVEPVGVTSQHHKGSPQSFPTGESLSATSRPAFQFFTSDLQTTRTADILSTNAANEINKNNTTSQAPHQTQNSTCGKVVSAKPSQASRQSDQRSKPYNEGMLAGQAPPRRASEVRAKPRLVLQGKEAVRLPETSKLTEEDFYCWVIGWDSQWLDICGPDVVNDQYPPILAKCPYKSVKSVPPYFDSVKEYYEVFIPLLLHEVWAQIQNRRNSCRAVQALFVESNRRESRQTGNLLSCTIRVTTPVGRSPVNRADLLRISLSNANAFGCLPLLAVVTSTMPTALNAPSNVSGPSRQAEGQSLDISVLILAKSEDVYGALLSTIHQNVDLEVIHSLLPALHQFKALTSLPNLGMIASDILRFRRMDVFCPGPAPQVSTLESPKQLNKRQLEAVSIAFQAINQPDTLPRICIIQGSPGTGKTHAVIELVMQLLRSRMKHQRHNSHSGNHQHGSGAPKAPPILLCAPSDTAIDVLTRHLSSLINKLRDEAREVGGNEPWTIVRVGSLHDIHSTTRHVGMESHVRSLRCKETSENLFKQNRKKKIAELKQNEILELKKRCGLHKTRGEDQEANLIKQLKIVHSEIKDLQRQRAELDKKPKRHYEEYIMNKADIVCCTVNGCGSQQLQRNSNNNNKSRRMKFSCVIMDEANQCSELDSIIPLQNCSMKVVLVGDTQSHPPTVTSKIAWQHGLYQSLFERLCRLFERSEGATSPVHYLLTQQRMHPAICQFPSKHFHRGRTVNDKMAKRKEIFFLRPYLFFNVSEGQEIPKPFRNFINEKEADMVRAVYCMICKEKARNQTMFKELMAVGVTTLYDDQVQCLGRCITEAEKEIKRSFPPDFVLPKFEVSTLDKFQGREKDVIILSCVRANRSSDQSALGLVGDKKRLNVSITRARYSLFIVGHVPTLQTNSDWAALVADARQRQLLIDVSRNEYNAAAQRCSKNRQELETNTRNTTQTAPSVTPQLQTSQNAAPSTVCTKMTRSYDPCKIVESSPVGGKHSRSPKTQADPRQAPVASPSTSGEGGSTSGANGTNTMGDATGHRSPKALKSNVASPAAKQSPFKKKRVSFKESNTQSMSENSIQMSLTPKPMQRSNAAQSPTKSNPYSVAFQKLRSQRTASYNKLGWKRSPMRQKGNQHGKPVVHMPHNLRQARVMPAVAQAQPSGSTANKSSSSRGKTQHPSPVSSEYEAQNGKSTTSKSARNEQPNQKLVAGGSNGSHHTHLPGSPGMKRMSANNLSGPSRMNNASTHPERNASTSSHALRPALSNNGLTVPLQPNTSSSSEGHQPTTSGSGQQGDVPDLQETVEKIARKHANTKATRPLPGLQQDPRQARKQSKHEGRVMRSSNSHPVRIPYSGRESAPFD